MGRAGELDRRIRFERQATGRDDMGGSTDEGWVPLTTVWAKRSDMSDGERFADDAERAATRVTVFKVRSSRVTRGVTPIDRIAYDDSDLYEITGIKETREGRNNYLEFTTVVRNDWSDHGEG